MTKATLLAFLLLFSANSFGSDFIRILKMKGDKAVVKLPDTNFEKGQNIRVDRGVWNETRELNGRRMYRTDFDAQISSVNTEVSTTAGSADGTVTLISFSGRFGWNMKQYEVGPIFSYTATSGDSDESSLLAGGFFEYNFTMNEKGEIMIPYVGVDAQFGTGSEESGGSDVSTSALAYGIYGGVRYLPFNDHFFVNGGLEYRNSTTSADDSSETELSITTFGAFAGFGAYF